MKDPKISFDTPAKNSNRTSTELNNGATRRSKSSTKKASKELVLAVAERAIKQKVDLTDGYQNWFNVGMAVRNTFGEEGRHLFQQLCQFYPGYNEADVNAKYDNFMATSNGEITGATLVMIAISHGISLEEEKGNAIQNVLAYLDDKYLFRENIRTSRVEFKLKADAENQEWEVMNEKSFTTIFTHVIAEVNRVTRGDLKAIIRSGIVSKPYDILQDYFNALPPYNPDMEGAIDRIFDHFILADDEDKELCRMMFRKWFVSMVARWIKYDTETQAILVLLGPQYIGKTYILRKILPPELQQYLDVVLPNEDFRDKDRKLTLSEKFLLILDEWNIGRKVSNTIKAITSLSQTSLRDSYNQFRENRECIAAFAMTSNELQPLSMREGNRRYCSIKLIGTVNLNEEPFDYTGAYAEALHIIDEGMDYHFTKDEVARISEHNEQFTEPSACEEAIRKYYRIPADNETGIGVGTAEIIEKIRMAVPSSELSPSNVGRAMRHLGFRISSSKGYRRYYVFEISGADQVDDSKEVGKEIKAKLASEPF